ncbi:MAG: hypothetical protein ACKVWV_17855 [Planctomycetota bacterium]
MSKKSLADKLGWPDGLRVAVVLAALAVSLAPYVGPLDLGPFKVPQLPASVKDTAVLGGPVLLLAALGFLLPIWGAPRSTPQPIRTATYQAQLPRVSAVAQLFLGKDEFTLRSAFGFKALFDVNVLSMTGEYAANFFDVSFDREAGPLSWENCPRRMRPTTAGSGSMAIGTMTGTLPEALSLSVASADRVARWGQYQHDPMYINRQWIEMQQTLTELAQDPLLPKALADLLVKYLDSVGRNVVILFEILNAGSQEMPTRCRSLEELENMPTDWLWNRYMDAFDHLRPDVDKIIAFVRAYLDADNATQA